MNIIGKYLDVPCVTAGLDKLLDNPFVQDYPKAAAGILTTDTCTKTIYKEVIYKKKTLKVFGFTKGSGMIAPNMATMLGFLVINVDAPSDTLQTLLERANDVSFNSISVDVNSISRFHFNMHKIIDKDLIFF